MITGVVVLHVACGVIAVLVGAGAMCTVKGSRRHRRLGRVYLVVVAGLCASAPVLAALDWTHRWHLVVLAGGAAALAGLGLVGARKRRRSAHIAGMGGAYIVVLTAFYIDNGPRLPLWNQLPPVVFWLLPAAAGLPVLLRALRRHHLRPHQRSTDIREPA